MKNANKLTFYRQSNVIIIILRPFVCCCCSRPRDKGTEFDKSWTCTDNDHDDCLVMINLREATADVNVSSMRSCLMRLQ